MPSILSAVEKSRHQVTVTVLDNQSSDDSERLVSAAFPEADFVKAPKNLILCSYNAYLAHISEPVAILLNNDIRVDVDFIDPLIEPFLSDDLMFLTAPKVLSFDGSFLEAASTRAGFKYGMFWSSARYPGHEMDADQPSDTFSAGFGAFDRKKFLEAGGYDPLYLPGIMEDADLCLKAKRKGYHLRYAPESVVYHMGQASFHREFGKKKTLEIAHRNTFLFMWKNYHSPGFWLQHLFFLPARLAYAALKGNGTFIKGFIQACGRHILK